MSDIEKRLRDALGAAAETVEESRPRRPFPQRRSRRSRFPVWFLPLCAAASVIAIVAGYLGLRSLGREPQPLDKPMPKFFITTVPSDGKKPSRLQVRDAKTGEVLDARQAAPREEFDSVAAVGDGRTYFVATRHSASALSIDDCSTEIQKVFVDAGGRITEVGTALDASAIGADRFIGALAIDSKGSKIAYTALPCTDGFLGRAQLHVVDLSSGRHKSWKGAEGEGLSNLALTADGRSLFFSRLSTEMSNRPTAGSLSYGAYRIDLHASSSGDLNRAGILVRQLTSGMAIMELTASRSGQRIFIHEGWYKREPGPSMGADKIGIGSSTLESQMSDEVVEVSARDGRTLRVVYLPEAGHSDYKWMKLDSSGRYLLGQFGLIDLANNEVGLDSSRLRGASDAAW